MGRRAAREPGIAPGSVATIRRSPRGTGERRSARSTRTTGRTLELLGRARRRRPGRFHRCRARGVAPRTRCSPRPRAARLAARSRTEDRRRRELVARSGARPARRCSSATASRRCSTFRCRRTKSARASPSRRSSCARSTSSMSTPPMRCFVGDRLDTDVEGAASVGHVDGTGVVVQSRRHPGRRARLHGVHPDGRLERRSGVAP